jgi:UDP-N-acetylglucosamine 2-epimerase (non-hydrolysing)
LTILGTRPELIKLAPVVRRLRDDGGGLTGRTCFSGQHVEMIDQVLGDLGLEPDSDLRCPSPSRTLSQNLAYLLERLDGVLEAEQPSGVLVQGDTTSTFAAALAAHHRKIPCFHVEAGLRTGQRYSPFPEEMYRRLVGQLAALHFAPTARARENLVAEGVKPELIEVTGNTGIDALHMFASTPSPGAENLLARLRPGSRKLLVTLHRRENADHVSHVTAAVRRIVAEHRDVDVIWILHLNGTRKRALADLSGIPGVHLFEPQPYRVFAHLLRAADLVLTDSGGVQEEAPVFGKPILVLRGVTERHEAVETGNARVVGCETDAIVAASERLLHDPAAYRAMSAPASPFGDGRASERIVQALRRFYGLAPASRDSRG